MTLQIRSADFVSDIPITEVRAFFKHVVSRNRDSFDLPWLQDRLFLDEKSALALALELSAQGYVEPLQNGEYNLTEKGRELMRASAAGKVSRKTAESALAGLLARVEQYNSDANKILTIDAVVVFGSFLSTKSKLGDLDVAVKCRDRNMNDPDRAKTVLAYAKKSRRYFSTFIDELCWANTELYQILKARKRTIAIQLWDSFLVIANKDPDHFHYKVVFGNPEEVAAEIRAQARNAV